MIKLNKKSKQNSVDPKALPPTGYIFKIELNHSYTLEVSREIYNELTDRDLAIERKQKLIKNKYNSGSHLLTVARIASNLYNKVTAYNTYSGIVLKLYKEYQALLSDWRYKSCIAILMARV